MMYSFFNTFVHVNEQNHLYRSSDVEYLKTDYPNKISHGMDWKYDFEG